MRISVVISTYNRAESLGATLETLRWQRHDDFEVLVVNGPSDDGTAELLDRWDDAVRVLQTDDRNLSRSRNVGVAAAAGDVVAFIDDDAIPEPRWLEDLVAEYRDGVAGVGGLVLDHTGVRAQYEYSVSDRIGRTDFDRTPVDRVLEPDVDDPHFPYLQGTNMSFRRSVLAEIGGFDEEIEYNYDEVEVALRIFESGDRLVTTGGAAVHHKFLPSHQRREKGLFTDPFLPVKNRVYFALANGRGHLPTAEILGDVAGYREGLAAFASSCVTDGRFDLGTAAHFRERLDAGFDLGVERGLRGRRRSIDVPPADPDAFRPFPVRTPPGRRMSVCFVSLDFPPARVGGVARYTADLARDMAALGHEIHVVTRDDGPDRIDFEDGVWVHRVPGGPRWLPGLEGHPLRDTLAHLAQVRGAVARIHRRTPIDVLNGNLWIAEPLLAAFDPRLRSVLTCATPMRVVAGTHASVADDPGTALQIGLEDHALSHFDHLHSLSEANLRTIEGADVDLTTRPTSVLPLGMIDRSADVQPLPREDGTGPEILWVGRLEPRKGIDVFIRAATALLARHPDLRVRVVGAENPYGGRDDDRTWTERAMEAVRDIPGASERLLFEGELPDEDLYRRFASCDIFCAPSRYESFGLVLLEAMMFGRPAVSCDAGGIPEVAVDGETALLVPPGDADALEEALESLVTNPGTRERMGRAARARFEAEFEQGIATGRTVELFERVVRERSAAALDDDAAHAATLRATIGLLRDLGLSEADAEVGGRALISPGAFPTDLVGVAAVADGQPPNDAAGTIYRFLLGRDPEPAGRASTAASLASAPALEIVRVIAASDEGRANGLDATACDDVCATRPDVAVRRLQAAFWRKDDGFAERVAAALGGSDDQSAIAEEVAAAIATGTSREQIVRALLEAPRIALRVPDAPALCDTPLWTVPTLAAHLDELADVPDLEFVDGLYRALLRRAADPEGRAGWVARLGGGEPRPMVVRELAGSVEAQGLGVDPVVVANEVLPAATRLSRARPTLRRRVAHRAMNGLGVEDLRTRLRTLDRRSTEGLQLSTQTLRSVEALGADGRTSVTHLEWLATQLNDTLQEGLDRYAALAAEQQALIRSRDEEREQLATEQIRELHGLSQQVTILAGKQAALALDVREKLPDQPTLDDVRAPEIVDPAALERVMEERGGLYVNVGCGEKPLDGYVNVDFRPLSGVAVVADARHMPFEPGTVQEIMSAHLVEHFRQRQLELHLIPAWRRLLAPGGCLRIVCPNWAAMIEHLNAGVMTFAEFKLVTFGAQDYSGDDHFAMYSPETLMDTLRVAGFERFELLETHRQNGLSPEIELLAWPAEAPATTTAS